MRFFSNPGSGVRPVRSPVVQPDGSIVVETVGKENLQDYINSFEDVTNINSVLARYQSGDPTALNARAELYGDFTVVPKTYAQMLQKVIDAEHLFDSLPADTRSKFGYDFHRFFAASADENFLDLLGLSPTLASDSGSSVPPAIEVDPTLEGGLS